LVAQARGQATKKKMKAFLPQWILWVVVPALLVMWALVTFSTFGAASPRSRYEIFRWLGATAIFALVGLMLWLMATGRLPAYVIEIEGSDDRSSFQGQNACESQVQRRFHSPESRPKPEPHAAIHSVAGLATGHSEFQAQG
jgi:hypothetical protein